MNKDFNATDRKQYNGDEVIERGYEIYDEWKVGRLSSRRIVIFVERVISIFRVKRRGGAFIEAVACLFALDMRIKEKYSSLLRCILSYFSWRRETRALVVLKGALNIPLGETDIRAAVELVLVALREDIDGDETEGSDDETRGGKRNGKAEEELTDAEEKQQDKASEDAAEEITDSEEKEEASEKNAEDISEDAPENEPTNEDDKERQAETSPEEAEVEAQENAEPKEQEEKEAKSDNKEENNGPDGESEPSNDKNKTTNTYDYAADFLPISEQPEQGKPTADKISFIDEVIIDNMVKGKADFITHNPLDDIRAAKDNGSPINDTASQTPDKVEKTDKDDRLYDVKPTNGKETSEAKADNTPKKTEPGPKAESTAEQKPGAAQNTSQNPQSIASLDQKVEDHRVPLQVDITESMENDMRNEINWGITPEAVDAIKNAQSEYMSQQLAVAYAEAMALREQVNISNTELGMDAPVTEKTAPVQAKQPGIAPSIK